MTTSATATDWRTRARNLAIQGEAWIEGRYAPAASGATFECLSPIDGRLIAQVASTDAVDVDRAVAAARRAFEDGRWARQPPASRKKVLLKFAELLLLNRDELALLETLDMGKPISDSLAVDIPATARCIAWYAEAVDKIYDEIAPTTPDALAMITREPVGVVAAIVPWNFPLIMAAWKIGPALAAGNSLILKPSEKSPLSAIRIGALAAEAGIPDGVFSVLPGFGQVTGQALARHMDVDCIGFTGSTRTGKLMLEYSAQSNMKRVWLECGGKSPNIILADCPDLDRAADRLLARNACLRPGPPPGHPRGERAGFGPEPGVQPGCQPGPGRVPRPGSTQAERRRLGRRRAQRGGPAARAGRTGHR